MQAHKGVLPVFISQTRFGKVHGGKRTFTSLNKRREKSWEGLNVNQHTGACPYDNRRWLFSICPVCIELIHVGKYLSSMDKPILFSIPRMAIGHKTSVFR